MVVRATGHVRGHSCHREGGGEKDDELGRREHDERKRAEGVKTEIGGEGGRELRKGKVNGSWLERKKLSKKYSNKSTRTCQVMYPIAVKMSLVGDLSNPPGNNVADAYIHR